MVLHERIHCGAESLLEAAFAAFPAGVCLLDGRGRVLALNPPWRRFIVERAHFSLEVGDNYLALLASVTGPHASEARRVRDAIRRVIAGEASGLRFELPCGDGDPPGWVEVSINALRVGNERGALIVLNDVTERRRKEQERRESQRFLKTLLKNMPGWVYRCANDPNWTMEFLSGAVEPFTGYTVEELLGPEEPTLGQLIHPDDRQAVWDDVQAALAERRPFELIYRLKRRDGDYTWVWERGRGVFSEAGELLALEGWVTDISERVLLEERLKQSQKMEAVGRLAGGVAHDFNNLLTVILSSASLLEDALSDDAPEHAELALLRQAAERAARLTKQLLAFARRQVIEPRPVDLNALIAGLEEMLRRLLGSDIVLEARLLPDLWRVRVDPSQVEQVLINLIANARHAMPSGGTVILETANVHLEAGARDSRLGVGDWVRLTVRDTGHGMSQETLAHLFEPFFTTKGPGEGTGLGVASCYGIVKQAGGHIHVESEPSRGTAFHIHLPRCHDEIPEPEEPVRAPRREGRGTILLVEDDPLVMKVATLALRGRGYEVITASSGPEALDVIRQDPRVHLVITDLVMPKMGGRELAAEVRRLRPEIRVLYISGYSEAAGVEAGVLEEGAQFLEKPFTPAALTAKVRELLER